MTDSCISMKVKQSLDFSERLPEYNVGQLIVLEAKGVLRDFFQQSEQLVVA